MVQGYLDQINRFNHAGPYLNVLIDVAPHHIVMAQAIRLNNERTNGQVRSPLHSIPVVLKHNILTHLGTSTTGGNWAFVGAKCVKSATVVHRLADAGMNDHNRQEEP